MDFFDRSKRRLFRYLVAIVVALLLINLSLLSGVDVRSNIKSIPIPLPIPGKGSGSGPKASLSAQFPRPKVPISIF
jgi:hypothetical protein